MGEPAIATAAEFVASARLAGNRLAAFDPALGIDTLDLAYRVQAAANELVGRRLGDRVGHKIGGTSAAMRAFLGWDEPVAGEVFAATAQPSGARLKLTDYRRPGIESEVAVRLGADLPARDAPYGREEVEAAVAEAMVAIEVVDDRYVDFRAAGAPLVVADNAFNAGLILGRPAEGWRELRLGAVRVRTSVDGRPVAEGTADALLGHPMAALLWLAERRRTLNLGLLAGEVVSLGSVTPVRWLEGRTVARVEAEGLGVVELILD